MKFLNKTPSPTHVSVVMPMYRLIKLRKLWLGLIFFLGMFSQFLLAIYTPTAWNYLYSLILNLLTSLEVVMVKPLALAMAILAQRPMSLEPMTALAFFNPSSGQHLSFSNQISHPSKNRLNRSNLI